MKKFNFVVLSILTVVLSSVLMACSFKSPGASFSKNEVVVSLDEALNLDDYLTVEGVSKTEISYQFSNADILSTENNRQFVANKSGKTKVYATYKNNSLASMQIVVRKVFSVPTSFSLSETGQLSWNTVFGYFENEEQPTIADSYVVSGTFTSYKKDNPDEVDKTKTINETVTTNSYQLTDYGVYDISVVANGKGYFAGSENSQVQKLYYGYMEEISTEDLKWSASSGELSWSAISGATYQVKFDGVLLDEKQAETSKDLSSYFQAAEEGEHSISVLVYDQNDSKLARESQVLTVEKLSMPDVKYNFSTNQGGKLNINAQTNVLKFDLILTNTSTEEVKTLTFDASEEGISTDLFEIESGIYDVKAVAKNDEGLYFQSDALNFGKVYKLPTLEFSGNGENVLNDSNFKAQISCDENLVDSNVIVKGIRENDLLEGLNLNETTKEIQIQINNAGRYGISVLNIARNEVNQIDDYDVCVINSDLSQELSVVKVGAVDGQSIAHQYNENKSEITFNEVDYASNYELRYWNGVDFEAVEMSTEPVVQEGKVKFVFDGKIENLFEATENERQNVFKFQIVAKGENENLSINSSAEKQIILLSAPETDNSGDSTNKVYTWAETEENVGGYFLQIYKIDAETYNNNLVEINIDTKDLVPEEQTVLTNSFTFDDVGYYYVKIYTLTEDEDKYISSTAYMEDVLFIAEKLSLGTVDLGYDEQYVGYDQFTASTGYFLKVENALNVDNYQITVGDGSSSILKIDEQNGYSIYLLTEDFSDGDVEVEISVVGMANDQTIYVQSDPKTLTVERIANVSYDDLIIDDLTSSITLKEKAGVSGAEIWYNDGNSKITDDGTLPSFAIKELNNFSLRFTMFGSKQEGGIYLATNDKIYLDSFQSTITFARLDAPTNFKYYDGKLTFDHAVSAGTEYYVLDLKCQTPIDEIELSVKFDQETSVIYNGLSYVIGSQKDFLTQEGNTITINLANLLNILKTEENLAGIYNQATDIKFYVYGHQIYNNISTVILSSQYATIYGNSAEMALTVEKMPTTKFSFMETETDYTFNWEAVDANELVAAETSYQIFMNDSPYGKELTGVLTANYSKSEFEVSTLYTFFVRAKNPYYLESDDSNLISIYQLQQLSKLELTQDAKLSYQISTTEADFYDHVQVNINSSTTENRTGLIDITESGTYTLTVVGKTIQNTDSSIYYLNSQSSTWTLKEMSSLAPADKDVSYSNNLIQWNPYGENAGISSLAYVVIFKDSNKFETYTTTQTSVNLTTEDVYAKISQLASGTIEIGVSAYLLGNGSYVVNAGGTIYYALNVELLNGKTENHHYLYNSTSTIKKLTTPDVKSVVFDYEGLENAQFPDIEISFVGNYGDSGRFNIFINDSDVPVMTTNITAVEGNYTFTLTRDYYNNSIQPGQTMTIRIVALSDVDIPSSAGKVDIVRVVDLANIGFEESGIGFTQNLVVEFNEEYLDYTLGGVNLQITYQPTDGSVLTEYLNVPVGSVSKTLIYDLSAFFADEELSANLSNGGSIKLSAYLNNYADDNNKIYYLAAPTIIESSNYNVLKQVSTVSQQAGGFEIDASLNNPSTVYIVEYNASRFEVEANSDGKFYFEFPNDWENKIYDLTIYASEDGYINSVKNTISFNLNRIARVSEVSMERNPDDLSSVILSWDDVSGASGYLLKMYRQDDVNRENLLFSIDTTPLTSTTQNGRKSFAFADIFGDRYENLTAGGKITEYDLMSDIPVSFELITIGGNGLNNSYSFVFNATIKGNPILVEDVTVDEFGRITFEAEADTNYLYRLVGTSTATEYLQWTVLPASQSTTKQLDVSNYVLPGNLFNLELIVIGSAVEQPTTSSDFEFVLDSVEMTTLGTDLTFVVNEPIIEIGYNELLPSSLAITMLASSAVSGDDAEGFAVYAGLSKDGITTGDVVKFVPTEALPGENEGEMIYAFSIVELVSLFEGQGKTLPLDENTKLYFWAYRPTTVISGSYVVSTPYEYTIGIVEETTFQSITKVGDLGDNFEYAEDYVNSYAVFENTDVDGQKITTGFFVRISRPDESDDEMSFTRFITKDQIENNPYFEGQNVFTINITEIFEAEELKTLDGKFEIEFARLQLDVANGNKFIVSNWLSSDGEKEFVFERLPKVSQVYLESGNLYWESSGENTSKYYVYFFEDVEGELYNFFSTEKTYFNASDYAGTNNSYYIAVQSISEDPYMLSSIKEYVSQTNAGETEPVLVIKNKISSPLELKDGKLYFDWDANGDFYKTFMGDGAFAEISNKIASETFTSPFTFSLQQLVDNTIKLRIRFTSLDSGTEGIRKVFDINAKYLLASLTAYGEENSDDILGRFSSLLQAETDSTRADLITEFRNTIVINGSFGVANASKLFDDLFESLQTGRYKVEYCLLGNSATLTSPWYNFANSNGENVLYVNEEPLVNATKTTDENDMSINNYQVYIKKSQIYDYNEGAYSLKVAENYNLKIYDDAGNQYVFAITKGVEKWSMSFLNTVGIDQTLSVYETNADGTIQAGGDYLMFYINHNDGDSLLGMFKDVVETGKSYKMQIYAVGTDYSTSSKSELFTLVLLDFNETFGVSNGEFVWGSVNNRKTSVIYKKHTSSAEEITEVDGSRVNSSYSLNGLGNGLYDYIKFVLFGELNKNAIYVDSEIYMVSNVYKLATPSLNNNYGYIGIDDSANIEMLGIDSATDPSAGICYSDGSLYNYKLYNSDPESSIYFTDQNSASQILYYEAGITGIELSHTDYDYKKTEEVAKQFNVISLGTSAELKIVADEQKYYLNNVYCVDIDSGDITTKNIALRSEVSTINASMLDAISNLTIEDGVLKWEAVEGKSGDEPLTIPTANGEKIVYKITVVQYRLSNTETGESELNVGKEYYYYTTNTYFDFTNIKEDQIVETEEKTYLKATVQATALNITESLPTGYSVELVEGGYGFGNLKYDGTETYVLMGNGYVLRQIDRLSEIDDGSLKVVNGRLTWQFTTGLDISDSAGLFSKYTFEVVDENGKMISGKLSATVSRGVDNLTNIFTITFEEDAGQMEDGVKTLTVYTSQGPENNDLVIKSFGQSLSITKLKTFISTHYTITSDNGLETLDLSTYFTETNADKVIAYITISGQESNVEKEIVFTKTQNKLFILRSVEDQLLITSYPADYIHDYLVIAEDEIATMIFEGQNENSSALNILYSDKSEEFVLQRSNWGTESEIVWDEENQRFTWNYNGFYSLLTSTTGQLVDEGNVLIAETKLYNDIDLVEESGIVLQQDEIVEVEEELDDISKILYQGQSYYIASSSYEFKRVLGEPESLPINTLFKIVQNEGEYSVVSIEDKNYLILTSVIAQPVYIIEVRYSTEDQLVYTYTTTENFFEPSLIAPEIRISISIKLGNTNIQSQELSYELNGVDYVSFDLFESGAGTKSNPYVIRNAEQFKNISKRMTKNAMLVEYSVNGVEVKEEEQFYFSIQDNIVLSTADDVDSHINGVLMKGTFNGIIYGNNFTITYISNGTDRLTQSLTISEGYVLGPGAESQTTFNYGTALFETLSSNSEISNLNISVSYSTSNNIPNHSLIAGLAITNNGRIDGVKLTDFSSNFIGFSNPATRIMMVYSGLVSKNEGGNAIITNCRIETNMSINDYANAQVIIVGGIAFMNFAIIENCEVGKRDAETFDIQIECSVENSTVQVAGVVNTNSSSATIRNSSNNFDITVSCNQTNSSMLVYIAGVVDYRRGELDEVVNNGTINVVNVNSTNLHQGDVSIN